MYDLSFVGPVYHDPGFELILMPLVLGGLIFIWWYFLDFHWPYF